MTEKDFKKIISDQESKQENKVVFNELKDKLIEKVKKHLHLGIEIKDTKLSDWSALGIYTSNVVTISLDVVTPVINKQYETNLIFNEFENIMYFLNASKVERFNNYLKVLLNDVTYILELKSDYLTPVTYLQAFLKKLEDKCKCYTLFKNAMSIVNYFINQDSIEDINVFFLTNLFIKALEKESVENKYYKYLGQFIKALDDFTNNKKFEISDFVDSDNLMNLSMTEAKLSEYRKLRKALVKAVAVEEEQIKFDTQYEVLINVNPIFNEATKTFAWHYSLVGKNISNSGGVYSNNEIEYQTAILKGVFKALKAVVDMDLAKKRIILKCDYEGILTSKMLTSDENKSRMKTINSLIDNHNLRIQCK